jgi:hypothetical protein
MVGHMNPRGVYQAAEKRPCLPAGRHLRRCPHPFPCQARGRLVAAYNQVRLTPQDCLPDRQVKSAAGALHLGIFEQSEKNEFFTKLLL